MANLNKKNSETAIRIGEVRFSYPRVFEPRVDEQSGKAKYSCCILIGKDNKEALQLIEDATRAAAKKGADKFWKGKIPANLKKPLRDGDTDHPEDPAFEGMMFLNASNPYKPKVAARDEFGIVSVEDPMDFYAGCYGAVTLEFFPYEAKGNKGVGVSLGNVIKLREGEHLAGSVESAEASFADLVD